MRVNAATALSRLMVAMTPPKSKMSVFIMTEQ